MGTHPLEEKEEYKTELQVRDLDTWKKLVKENSDPYGAACISYAERWGIILQKYIMIYKDRWSPEQVIEKIAGEVSRTVDTEGITGFMYSAAVYHLTRHWVYGEALRRWHNLSVQLGNEGETANRKGGVLNTAMLHIDLGD